MLLAQYNLSRLIVRLVKSGYIDRLSSQEDRRGQILKITRGGREVLRRMWPAYQSAIQKQFAKNLNSRDFLDLCRILGKLRD